MASQLSADDFIASFIPPVPLNQDQLDRQQAIRSAAMVFARQVERLTRDVRRSDIYRNRALENIRSVMLMALDAVAVEPGGGIPHVGPKSGPKGGRPPK